jgi:hypothetical protein
MDDDVAHPPALATAPCFRNESRWESPLILVPDRTTLIHVLGLCGPRRFHETYAFLMERDRCYHGAELASALGIYTQCFAYDDTERLLQV